MNVQDLMTRNVTVCDLDTSIASAAMMMWDSDCGMVPVVGRDSQVVGVLTDRDITMALATKGKTGSEISAKEVINGSIDSCSEDDDVKTALSLMAAKKIRRLPVIDQEGKLKGILSINDAIVRSEPLHPELSDSDVMVALRDICTAPVTRDAK